MKYWITLKGQEDFPMVIEVDKNTNFNGFIRGKRYYKNGKTKEIGFNGEEISKMEQYDDEEDIDVDNM